MPTIPILRRLTLLGVQETMTHTKEDNSGSILRLLPDLLRGITTRHATLCKLQSEKWAVPRR